MKCRRHDNFRRISTLILLLLAIVSVCGCAAPLTTSAGSQSASNVNTKAPINILVTSDFGNKVIFKQEIDVKSGTTALDALQAVANVETEYGGGFISSVNGINSEYGGVNSKKDDWFFYINGIACNVGAGDYILQTDDIEHWDFHDWSYHEFIPAIVGDYPQPFYSNSLNNTVQTVVVYEKSFASEAANLVIKLKNDGVSQASAVSDDQLTDEEKEKSNLIIIAGPENGLISELNKLYDKLGFYAYLESGKIIVLDATGKIASEYGPGTGIIQATQNPWNPNGVGAAENTVWMVTGSNIEGVMNAATVLTNTQDKLTDAFAVIINGGQVIKIP